MTIDLEATARRVLDSAFEIHTTLGSGMLESCYEACLAYELSVRGSSVVRQKPMAIHYKDLVIRSAFRADLLVDNELLVEIKSIAALDPVHTSQVVTYLRCSGLRLGLLINFGARSLRHGIHRVSNSYL